MRLFLVIALFALSSQALACLDSSQASHDTPLRAVAGLQAKKAVRSFGAPISMKEAKPLAAALSQAKATGLDKTGEVLVTADVQKVCEKKGCWMEVTDGDTHVRMKFKDYGFFVPTELNGKRVMAQGVFEEKTESVKQQQHWLKDGKASKEAVAAVKEEKVVTNFIASGVQLVD